MNVRRRIYIVLSVMAAATCLLPSAGMAQDAPTFESLWAEARQNPECIRADFDNFILINCNEQLTVWYFTLASHPAHPGVIKRELLLENGAVISRIEGDYFGEGAEQIAGRPAFETWLAEIRDLDRQMREVMGAATGREPRPATD